MRNQPDEQPDENEINVFPIKGENIQFEDEHLVQVRAPAHVEAASPLLKLMIILVGLLALLTTISGVIAIIYNSLSETKINILGMSVSTGHVGVAFVGLGIIMMIIVYKNISSSIYKLAALPKEQPRRSSKLKRRNRAKH